MAGKFSIEAVFKGKDLLSGLVSKMETRVGKFTRTMKRGFNKADRQLNKLTKGFKTFGIAAAASLLVVGGAAAKVTNIGAEFEQTLVNAAAKFPEGIRKGTAAFEELEKVARKTGATTEFTATQSAQGLEFLSLAGFNAVQSIAALPGIVDLATAAQVDLATASDIATDSLGAFGLATKDPTQLAKNLARVSDVLAKTTTSTNTNMETLFEGIIKGAPAFTLAEQSIESFSALMGVMANSGIKGAEAGTILKNTVLRLSNPVGVAAKVLRGLGVSVSDSEGNFRDILDIMEDFEKGLKGVGSVQKAAALGIVFGSRAISGLGVQLKEGTTSIAEFRKTLIDSTGTVKSLAGIMRDTLQARINSTTSAFEGLIISVFKLGDEGIVGLVERTTELIRIVDANVNSNKGLIQSIGVDLLNSMMGLTQIVGGLVAVLLITKTTFTAIKIVSFGLTAATWLYHGAMFALPVVLFAAKAAMFALRATMILFNIAMTANPIGLLIVAVGALVTAGILLVKNWDTVKAFFAGAWESIVENTTSAVDKIESLISTVLDPFKKLSSGVSGLFEKFGSLFKDEKKTIKVDVLRSVKTVNGNNIDKFTGQLNSNAETENGQTTQRQEPQVISPATRAAAQVEETREINKSTLDININDEKGRTQVEKKGSFKGIGLKLEPSGAL